MRIGEAAENLGLTTHLLRHWEAEGLINPPRTVGGSRRYDSELLDTLTIAIKCQEAGMPLNKIARLLNGDRNARINLIAEQRATMGHQRDRLTRTVQFLDHVLECSHPVIRECPACCDFMARTSMTNDS